MQVLHSALAPLRQQQAQVLREVKEAHCPHCPRAVALAVLRGGRAQPTALPYLGSALEVEGEHVLPAPGLALPHQEHPVRVRALQLHQLGRLHPGDGAMEPGVAGQEVICFLAGGV